MIDLWSCCAKVGQKESPRAFIFALYNCPSKQDGVVFGVDRCSKQDCKVKDFLREGSVHSMKGWQWRTALRLIPEQMNSFWKRRVPHGPQQKIAHVLESLQYGRRPPMQAAIPSHRPRFSLSCFAGHIASNRRLVVCDLRRCGFFRDCKGCREDAVRCTVLRHRR